VFADTVLVNEFHTPNEGIAGTLVEVYNQTAGTLLFSDFTNAAGGFNIALTGVEAGHLLRISAPDTGLTDQTVSITGYTTGAAVYGEHVNFYNIVYAAFVTVPEPGGECKHSWRSVWVCAASESGWLNFCIFCVSFWL